MSEAWHAFVALALVGAIIICAVLLWPRGGIDERCRRDGSCESALVCTRWPGADHRCMPAPKDTRP